MSKLRSQFLADKARRDAARYAFDVRMDDLKADYEERGLAGRVFDEVAEQALDVLDEAIDVTAKHPGIAAGTMAALAVLLLRNPILAALHSWLGLDV